MFADGMGEIQYYICFLLRLRDTAHTRVLTVYFNPLTTNDNYSRHRNSAACNQLVQSILKIGSVLAERVG